jgi:ABC-2 type transport system ATP-binding protein
MAPSIELTNLEVSYGKKHAVKGVSLAVEPGRCHALFGRNGAGKTSLLKAVLGLVPASAGSVRVLGLNPLVDEVEVKSRLAFVPDAVGFYPWMSVRDVLEYDRSFRARWRPEVEAELLTKFGLDLAAPAASLSKGQKTQLALTAAVAADPELLILDEPTSGLDPLVRRQFLEAVIGAFQDRDPQKKTLFVSTHLIREFEGIVDDFSVMAEGKLVLSMNADAARERYARLNAWFESDAPSELPFKAVQPPKRSGRSLEVLVDGGLEAARAALSGLGATKIESSALSLEDIFFATGCAGSLS